MTENSSGTGKRNCEACGCRLVMALSTTHRPAPITLQPRDGGNVLLFRAVTGEPRYVILQPGIAATLASQGVPLRVNHFAECPQADRFRARREENEASDDGPGAA